MSERPILLAVPNVSDGGDETVLAELIGATEPARLLDVHSDPDHGRSVLTLAAPQGEIAPALARLAAAAAERIDITGHAGIHPHVGSIDVAPVVHTGDATRGAAIAEALTAADMIGALEIPVFLYGVLATDPGKVERADIRRGGPRALAERVASKDITSDFGPKQALHPTAGAALVTARPPLLAFNLDLDSDDVELAKRIAGRVRESNEGDNRGLPGVRAIGLWLPARGRAQVSFNVHDHRAVPLRTLVEAVRAEAPIAEAELVGLAPRAAFDGFPPEIPLRGFDPDRHLIENALRSVF